MRPPRSIWITAARVGRSLRESLVRWFYIFCIILYSPNGGRPIAFLSEGHFFR
jgi:hypothetical protein